MKQSQAAFTLFEVLIAMVVLSIGLLGLASLQAAGMRSNNDAYMRSQASVLAYDMADRIRANRTADYLSALPNGTENTGCLSSPGCDSANMAQNDVFEWQTAVGITLPLGTGTITLASGVYTISITWDDDRDPLTTDPAFLTSFIP